MSKTNNAPVDIITGKDLDYLSDMFQWNYVVFKKCCNDIQYLSSQDIIDIFSKATDFFEQNLNNVLDIIDSPGGEDDE